MLSRRNLLKWFAGAAAAAAVVDPGEFEEIYEDEIADDPDDGEPLPQYDLCDPIVNRPYADCTEYGQGLGWAQWRTGTVHWHKVRGITIGGVVIDEVGPDVT